MGRYNFVSPGALAGNAIEQFFLQREETARQEQEADFRRQQQQAQLKLQADQERRVAEAQTQAQGNLEKERGFRRATTLVDNSMRGDPIDETTRALLDEQGYEGAYQRGQPVQGAHLGVDENSVDQYAVSPGILEMRGGSKYLNAEAQRQNQAAIAAAAQTAANERAADREAGETARAADANATRAQIAAATQATQAGLRAQENARRQDKADAEAKDRANVAAGVKAARAKIRGLAQELIDNPALHSITGPIEGRRDTFLQGNNAQALTDLNQLVKSLSLASRADLKGQGQISDYEAKSVEAAVSAINRAAGHGNVVRELRQIINAFAGDSPSEGGGSGDVEYDSKGNPIGGAPAGDIEYDSTGKVIKR